MRLIAGTFIPVSTLLSPGVLHPSALRVKNLRFLRVERFWGSGPARNDNAIDPWSGRSMHGAHAMSQPQPRLDDLRIDRSTTTASRPRMVTWLVVFVMLAIVAFAVWWLMRPKTIEVRTVIVR